MKVSLYQRSVAKNIRRLREQRGWNQGKLAHETRLSLSTIERIENPRTGIDPAEVDLTAIARVFRLDFFDLGRVPDEHLPVILRGLQKPLWERGQ